MRSASSTAEKLPSFDPAAFELTLEQNFAGDAEIFEVTALAFLESAEANLAELVDAFAAQDVDRTMRAAHRLKGETSLFHIAEVATAFKALEFLARNGQLPPRASIETAQENVARLMFELRTILS
jgi:HPt (histidine-containing phosphotransfer) domain-containing protein